MSSTALDGRDLTNPPPSPAPSPPRPLFMPREHGAYALVLAPLLTAFCRGVPSWVGVGFAVAVLAAFVAHEPALVLLAQRGGRAQRQHGAAARRAFGVRAAVALAAGTWALSQADRSTQVGVAVLVGLGLLQAALTMRAAEKSDLGTLLLALTASLGGVPVALANGWEVETAALTGGVFAVVGGVAMLTVRELIPRRKRQAGLTAYLRWMAAVIAVVIVAARALRGEAAAYFGWSLAPTLLVACGLLVVRPAPTRLRSVGWALAAAQVATFLVLAFA